MHNCTYNRCVEFEWNNKKAIANLNKHGVNFADTVHVLEDEMAITIVDDYSGENRYITVGMDALGRILVVVYTWREDRVRIIAARKATPKEIVQYRIRR